MVSGILMDMVEAAAAAVQGTEMTLPDSEGTQRAVTASHLIRRFNQAIHAGDPVGGIFNTVRMADLQAAIIAAGADKEDQVCCSATRACNSH